MAYPKKTGESDGAAFTLLYIEDHLANRLLMSKIFEDDPTIRFLSAVNGALGLETAHVMRPDLILLDIHLPDMDGFTVLERLQRNEATRRIPVVAVSANAMKNDMDRAMQAGFADYFPKPINIPIVRKRVEAHLLRTKGI